MPEDNAARPGAGAADRWEEARRDAHALLDRLEEAGVALDREKVDLQVRFLRAVDPLRDDPDFVDYALAGLLAAVGRAELAYVVATIEGEAARFRREAGAADGPA